MSALEAIGRPLRDWDGVDHEAEVAAESAALGWTDVPPGPAGAPAGPAGPGDLPSGREPDSGPPAPGVPGAAAGTPLPRPGRDLAGAVAEVLPTGPGLAAWLAGQDPATAAGGDLVAMAGAFRRVASWAQARELELIAHVAARSAAADPKAGLQADGRPAHVTDDTAAQVSLELVLSRYGAEAWASLAVTLRWRLPATAAALAEGRIDTYRAKILAEAVAPLSDDAARAVEDQVIPLAPGLTYGQMHSAVRRAVIAADPEGAEHRRHAAERRARVSLYPDQDGTAALVGACLPAPEAAAAYARISAIANAMKAAGAGGGLHFLRAQVLLGKIFDTLPVIPPPPGSPPDADPPPDDHDDGWTPGAPGEPPNGGGARPRKGTGGGSGHGGPSAGWPDAPPLTDENLPEDDGFSDPGPPPPDDHADWDPARGDPFDDHFASPGIQWPWPPIPPVVPAAPGMSEAGRPAAHGNAAAHGNGGTPGGSGRPPPGGLLDLTLPWVTFTGMTDAPGTLGRIGPVTGPEARRLASLALLGPGTQWRIILTDADRHAIAVARVPRAGPRERSPAGPRKASPGGPRKASPGGPRDDREPPGGTAVVGRVTIVMPADALDGAPASHPRLTDGIYARLLAAARRARDQAHRQAEADRHAPGGCAHITASPAYSPPPRLREFVAARDQTCRGPHCGQPAWSGDLDHTVPYDQGGLTCPCDLGAVCRRHHRLKQRPDWTLTQPRPGVFSWTTPAGRTYTTHPVPHYTG